MSLLFKELSNIVSKKAQLLNEEAKLWTRLSVLLDEHGEQVAHQPSATSPDYSNRLLTAREAAEYMSIPEATLSVWRCIGKGPAYSKIGTLVRYTMDDIEQFRKTKNRHQ